MITPAHKLTTRYRPVCGISVNDIVEMHQLSAAFHETVDLPNFLRDLQTNDGAIIVRNGETKAIRGFVTIKKVPLRDGQQQALGVLSGEAVLDPECGGEDALNDAFTRHLLCLWLTARGVPLYSLGQYHGGREIVDRDDGGQGLPCIGEISMSSLKPHLLRERLRIQGRRKSANRRSPPGSEALLGAAAR